MALEKEEYLWRMVNEHMTQARHQETLRSTMTTLLVTLSAAIVGFITFDKDLSSTDLAPSSLLLFLGIFGIFFSAKHYERYNFHIARVRSYRNALEQCFPGVDWKRLREQADEYHEPRVIPPQIRGIQKWNFLVVWSEEDSMKTSRFTDSQILAILKQAEAGSPVPELCREHGISSACFYKWRSKFGGMDASMMSQLKELQDENRRLKKMYAEAQLSADLLKEALAKKW
jgi:putative transposase